MIKWIANNIENGFLEEEQFQDNFAQDLGIGWYGFEKGDKITRWNLSFGGDFKIRRNILLNFALRTTLNKQVKFKSFLPIANIVCLM